VRGIERLALPIFKEKSRTERGCFFMPGIVVTSRESFDDAYRKFKRQSDRNLIVTEARSRQYYETKTEKRKKEKIATRKKILKKLFMLRRYESRL